MCYDTYALLLEYSELGYDYDSMETKYKTIIGNIRKDVILCEDQQKHLEGVILDMQEYIEILEKREARNKRKLKIMKAVSYSSLGANAILTLILLAKN